MSRMPYPHEDMISLVRRVYHSFGAQRLMWGTDTPMSQKPEEIPAALGLIDLALPTIPQANIDWIKGNTAATLFGYL
jgi:predicted TIM-barrel fold metal-dependent hydrolase